MPHRTGRTVLSALAAVLIAPALASAADRIYWTNESAGGVSYANLDGSGGGGNIDTTGASGGYWNGVAVDPVGGRVFWANWSGSKISSANIDGSGAGADLATTGATLTSPLGLVVFRKTGRVYWANHGGAKISWAALDGSGGGDLFTGGASVAQPWGVAIDEVEDKIYWANGYGANAISFAKLDDTGGANINTAGATVNTPEGVALDPVQRRIYWANYSANVISYAKLDGTGGADLATPGATVNGPDGVAIDPTARKIYWVNQGSSGISWANLDGSGGGDLDLTGATVYGPSMPAILKSPSAAGLPTVSGGATAPASLSCSQGSWDPDQTGSLLYRAPRSLSYSWTRDGSPVGGGSSTLDAATPGQYRCTVTAENAAGSTSQTSAPFTVSPPPPPPVVDNDRDGSPAGTDCDDNNPGRRPGLAEIVGNGIDEDCDGSDTPGRVTNTLSAFWIAFKKFTRVTTLTVKGAPAGSTITVTCKGRGCPFKKKTLKQAKAGNRKLVGLFNRRKKGSKRRKVAKLRPKARVEVRVTKAGWIGKVNRYTIRAKKPPVSTPLCLAIGATRPVKTC